jgi:hypothetical protein
VEVDSIADGHDLATVITRAKFNDLNDVAFRKCIDTVRRFDAWAALVSCMCVCVRREGGGG